VGHGSSPGGWETYTYDDDGRRTARVEQAGATTLHDDDFTYDNGGHVRSVTGSAGYSWTVENVYTGSGGLLGTDLYRNSGLPHFIEEYQTDGLGNVSAKRVDEGVNDPKSIYLYDDFSGLLDRIVALEPPYPPEGWQPDTTYNLYDEAGNVRYSGWRHPYDNWWALRGSANFYRADGKLLVTVVYRDSVLLSTGNRVDKRGAYEEYWYDALGRRVLVRRRTDALCTGSADCASTIERLVWDGDQILYELRAPGGDTLTTTQLNATPPYTGADHEQYGVVAYTHGPGIDAPLDVIRMEYGTWGDVELTVVPHTNWRGEYGAGSDTTGTVLTNIDFQWPADFRGAFHGDPGGRGLPQWFGSLIQDKRDMSGLMYMRNRYYDPNTGKFTQEDPIGLAGGLNLYGFAGGDPINFSDPFGLCKKKRADGKECNYETGDPNLDDPDRRQIMEDSFNEAPVDELGYKKERGGECTADLTCTSFEGDRDGVAITVTPSTAFEWHTHPNVGRPIPGGLPGAVYPSGPSEDKDVATTRALYKIGLKFSSYVVAPNTIYRMTPGSNGKVIIQSFNRWAGGN